MKLNNKGFAFSTMLYGTLAVITVVLYAILSISQSSKDTTYFFGDSILIKLNECVYDEIALENCYTSGSTTCDPTAYRACLGVSSKSTATGKIISETLKAKAVTSGDGLYKDPYVDKRYIYVGNNPSNYLEYSGKVWRIVSVEQDGTLRMIDYTSNINEKWDNSNQEVWEVSSLNMYLNNEYLATISDNSKLTSGKWQASYVYPSKSTANLSIPEMLAQDEEQDGTSSSFSQVGVLSISDYMRATSNTNCRNNMLTAASCTSWLGNYKGWTLNVDGEEATNVAYYFNTGDKLTKENITVSHRVYPVVVLNRDSVIEKGTGTSSDPYVLK